jgi:hypothetical protein
MKRLVFLLINHKWATHRYPAMGSEDQPQSRYRTCLRCGKVLEGGDPSGARP